MDSTIANIEDLRRLAQRRVPRPFFDYVDSGAFEELTLHANRRDLDALRLRQRVLAGVGDGRDLRTRVLGQEAAMPLGIAPTGLAGLVRADGEIHLARAARRAGVPFTLSTVSICSLEDVRQAVDGDFWFQLYVMRDRGVVRSLIERAQATRCPVLMVTADLAVQAPRLRDERNGMTLRPRIFSKPANLVDFLRKPGWVARYLATPRRRFGNLVPYVGPKKRMSEVSAWIVIGLDTAMSWADLEWIRGLWPGKLVVKGVLDADDARQAVRCGADALVVSNHGGRQFDAAPSSAAAFPAIADAVGDSVELFFDSGIRTGTDVLKALALGARAVLVGRAPLYGLGALGPDGVSLALELIRRELDAGLALAGLRRVAEISKDLLWDAPGEVLPGVGAVPG
jgi:L-lactate dehydrogenase (cytochrome)